MSGSRLRAPSGVLALVFLGCVGDVGPAVSDAPPSGPFIQVARDALTASDAGLPNVTGEKSFYVALKRSELGSKWFLSAFLTQWHPSEVLPVRSLGTRVVTFAEQNGKLFVFDATDGRAWSDTLDPTVIVEAYPLVTDYAPFNALPNAADYVLFDPSAGLNRFSAVSDDVARYSYARFQVDLTFLQRFRALSDGASWEEVFTGYTEGVVPGLTAFNQPFRGSGTLEMALRRYAEGAGFVPAPASEREFFGSSNIEYAKNTGALTQHVLKWNIHPGMTPIPWRISPELAALQADPQYQGLDIGGAITRGVKSWNDAFGFPVFDVVQSAPDDSVGDDEKNVVFLDPNPAPGLAFANWRENPNTGEIRGASVYFSAAFLQVALSESGDAGELPPLPPPFDAGTSPSFDGGMTMPFDAGVPAGATCSPNVVISQVFGGNSLTGAFNQDFVELHNRTPQNVTLDGWSVQYASATGTSSWIVQALSGTIAPGGYFLIGLASASDGGIALPHVDATGTLNLSATAGKVALVANVTPLTGCPMQGAAVDLVGYGGANCSETTAVAGASSSASVIRHDSCVDTNSNAMDFSAQTPSPRNASTAMAVCMCQAPVQPAAVAITSPDGGSPVAMPASAAPAAAVLAWDAMPQGSTCELGRELRPVAMPAGQTRKQFVEAVVQHAIAHEVGHTLGLRHNFKGSLSGSSVMDYIRDDEAAAAPGPGAYDVAAVRYLYGLDPMLPSQPFCTDEDRFTDAQCDIFDSSADPLTNDLAPTYAAKLRANLSETGAISYGDLWRVTRYVRAPASEAQRLQAFNVLVGDVAPPIQPGISALGANANAWADLLSGVLLSNLFLQPGPYRDEVQVSPALTDPTFRARVIEVTKGILVNSDGIRSFEMRRVAVDVLKVMQQNDAYQALLDAKAAIATERTQVTAQGQVLDDDLLARINAACSPYFQ